MTNEAATPIIEGFAAEFLDWAENHSESFIYVNHHGISLGSLADDPGWQGLVALAREAAIAAPALLEALESIEKGMADVPDSVLAEGRPALTAFMWRFSQERARTAIRLARGVQS